jgi:nitrous oxidase accessory protein
MKALITFLLFLVCPFLYGNILSVGNNSQYQNIISAINAAGRTDTVIVLQGNYKSDEIVITKSICLMAQKGCVLDGQNKYQVLTIRSSNVIVEGFTIINSGSSNLKELSGIRVENAYNVTLKNNILVNTFFGIYLANCNNCIITGNSIKGNAVTESSSGNGIHLWKCNHINVLNNHIGGHRDGIYFEFVTLSQIIGNTSEKNLRYGLHFMFSNDDNYRYNTFRNNGSGVAVMYTKNVLMEYNLFENNWGGAAYGLLLKEISHSHIRKNRFIKNTIAVYLEGSNDCKVERNRFESNGWALRLLGDCYDDTIRNNNFVVNTFDVSTNAITTMNLISDNYWDHYKGYDLNKDKIGDVPYHPVSLYAKIIEDYPYSIILLHSFFVDIMNEVEGLMPTLTPEAFRDERPRLTPFNL